jgi:hypothetical protein
MAKKNPQTQAHLAQLDGMITAKQASMGPKDGQLQIALAIAATTTLVTVNTTSIPFSVDPDDLFDLTFSDAKVGISDDQMPVFKANLTVLLSEITSDIAQIPENASLPIGKVADFVRLSLLSVLKSGQ